MVFARKCALVLLILLLVCPAFAAQAKDTPALAARPPMGWNSYDSYGTTINEAQLREAATHIARRLKSYGWEYVVVDMEWFVTNPTPAGNSRKSEYSVDEFGRYKPAPNRFPSAANGAGFKPVADFMHSLGLRFGVHMLRGIPRQAVQKDLPIAGSYLRASQAADVQDQCPWNPDNFGVLANAPAAQAYYDSVARQYADWGVDLVKVDCIASHPYKGDDIRMIRTALQKTGRNIILSLSPGPAPTEAVEEVRQYSDMWRISDDVWDLWHSTVTYPQGVVDQFPRVSQWSRYTGGGRWADADMLPLGMLGPAPGWGPPRATRLSHDEQRTLMTLWCIFRSPLMWGGNPAQLDAWTFSLLTNREVLAVDQESSSSSPVLENDRTVVWKSVPAKDHALDVAVFNLTAAPQEFVARWKELSLPKKKYKVRDLWQRQNLGTRDRLKVLLPPHGCVLYRLR